MQLPNNGAFLVGSLYAVILAELLVQRRTSYYIDFRPKAWPLVLQTSMVFFAWVFSGVEFTDQSVVGSSFCACPVMAHVMPLRR